VWRQQLDDTPCIESDINALFTVEFRKTPCIDVPKLTLDRKSIDRIDQAGILAAIHQAIERLRPSVTQKRLSLKKVRSAMPAFESAINEHTHHVPLQ